MLDLNGATTIAEVGIFDPEFPVGVVLRYVFDEPVHCEEEVETDA